MSEMLDNMTVEMFKYAFHSCKAILSHSFEVPPFYKESNIFRKATTLMKTISIVKHLRTSLLSVSGAISVFFDEYCY